MKHSLLLMSALLLGGSLSAQTSQRITAGKANEYALAYTLPNTALDIYIEAELSHSEPGVFYNYARRHLGISDAITETSRSARVLNVVIVPHGVANPNNRWTAQFKPGNTVSIALSENNIPLAINTDEVSQEIEVDIPEPREASPTALESEAARQAVTSDMVRSSSVSKCAELAAQRIFELRETRSDILAGEAENMPSDGTAMQLVLDNLAAQEAALTAMFTGTTSTHTVVERYSLLPDSTDINGRVLARLSAVDGLIAADNLAGAPITIDVKVIERGVVPVNEQGLAKTFPKGGVAYNIPGTAAVTVRWEGRPIATQTVSLAQLGITFGINPALFSDKRAPYQAIFDQATGALLKLEPVTE